jgi:hypothetical protein
MHDDLFVFKDGDLKMIFEKWRKKGEIFTNSFARKETVHKKKSLSFSNSK